MCVLDTFYSGSSTNKPRGIKARHPSCRARPRVRPTKAGKKNLRASIAHRGSHSTRHLEAHLRFKVSSVICAPRETVARSKPDATRCSQLLAVYPAIILPVSRYLRPVCSPRLSFCLANLLGLAPCRVSWHCTTRNDGIDCAPVMDLA
ncbi:hypothetical protein BDP81DRAFT_100559 [Colletotrichum phormii]|uniref:Uncharacterized protein n=1 Tax=Colletotrichum phormii TaxID=359342 RepID=A0AAI9ZKJ5_9PEZI|nr:uncharacterized protein BDP81DRAFT_100559 [Colletotrichum phormii]KAK1625225.1 hypothetical protein BDP81DRAFT_100559 [Colletotrichum phormii]